MLGLLLTRLYDLLLLTLLGATFSGGIPWQDHLILRHAADPRRAWIIVLALGYFLSPILREKSYFLRVAQGILRKMTVSRRFRWGLLATATLVPIGLAILQALALRVRLYDVGIFHQILWSLAHGHGFWSTISGAGNFLLDHTSFSLVLLLPFYVLSQGSPLFLPIVQPLLLWGGAAAWVFLAEKLSARLAAYTVLFVLCFESLWGNLEWGFHENAISFFALSWALVFLFLENELRLSRTLLIFALFLIAAASKEILLVDLAFAFSAWAGWRWKRGHRNFLNWAPQLLLAAGLILAFILFEKMPHPADKNYFVRYYSYLGTGIGGFFHTLLFKPWSILEAIGPLEILTYLKTVFLPWLALPLVALFWRPLRSFSPLLLIALPSFASAALSTYPPLRDAKYHYVLELWPALGLLGLVGLEKLQAAYQRFPWYALWLLTALLSWDYDPWGALREFAEGARQQKEARTELTRIPESHAVVADELTGPWLAGRLRITRWPDLRPFEGGCPEEWFITRSNYKNLPSVAPQCLAGTIVLWENADWVHLKATNQSAEGRAP